MTVGLWYFKCGFIETNEVPAETFFKNCLSWHLIYIPCEKFAQTSWKGLDISYIDYLRQDLQQVLFTTYSII